MKRKRYWVEQIVASWPLCICSCGILCRLDGPRRREHHEMVWRQMQKQRHWILSFAGMAGSAGRLRRIAGYVISFTSATVRPTMPAAIIQRWR